MIHKLMLTVLILNCATLVACNKDSNESGPMGPEDGTVIFDDPWPTNLNAILVTGFTDDANDLELMPPEQAGPPYSDVVPFPSTDVTEIRIGVEGDFLYMRVQFADLIPMSSVHIQPAGEVEEQWARNQGMNIAMNTDGNIGTGGGGEGVYGIDIFFAVGFEFGIKNQVYSNWDFTGGDLHLSQQQRLGELGAGGPGFDYAVVRYNIANLGVWFPAGQTVDVGSWSEAESYNADGTLKYHHFAFDRCIDGGSFSIPGP